MANSINVNQNNNNVSLQDANGKVTITDDKLGINIEVTQPVTNIVTVSTIGPQGQPGEIPSTGSFVLTSSFNAFTASYYIDSASFDTNILNNSSSIALLSGSFETFSGSYNTGSFTGSFYGDGSNLTGIVSSKWTGSNPITREGNVEITGSLIISGSSTFINIGPAIFSGSVTGINGFTGSLLGTAESASYVLNAESASYALTASYAANVPLTASYALNAESASYSSTASYVELAQTSSYYDETDPVFTAVSGTFVLTSSFDQFTSSYNTGSFTGSFYGDGSNLTGIVSSKWTGSNPISRDGNVEITGSLNVNDGITGSLYGTASWAENSITASYILQAVSASYALTASYVENAQTASYVLNAISSSYTQTASYVDTLNQDVLITGSLTVLQGATIYGSSSFTYVTASQLAVSASFISVNVFEPAQRFGGLKVYDSGSSTASASLAWDSLHNHWVYENVDGATYTGGMLLSGPRNTGSLGDEPNLTKWFVPRGDGGDHLNDSQIFTSASITQITGSLIVTAGITGSLSGSALTATSASYALTASYLDNYVPPFPFTGSALITGSLGVTGSLKITDSAAALNIIGNGFGQASLISPNGALVLTPGIYGVQINGAFPDLKVNGNITTDGYLASNAAGSYLTGSLQGSASYAATASYLAGAAPTITYIRRSDYTTSPNPNVNYLYCGQAVSGSSESANVWDISRLSISSSGATLTQTTSSAAWTDRYTYTYS
jgi:hypothetical protein